MQPTSVSLSVAPNPVTEGDSVTVTAQLSVALTSNVTVPLTVTRDSSESGDHGTLASITITAGSTSNTGTITTVQDADTDAETFTVALGSPLPSVVRAGSSHSVTVTISDNDPPTGSGLTAGGATAGGSTGGVPTSGGGATGGGGSGTRTPDDQHGDTFATATALTPPRDTTGYLRRRLDARLQRPTDVDTFRLDLPHAGVLLARTTGGDTTGRLYQAPAAGAPVLLATDTDSGSGPNFRLGVAVEPGTYYLAVSAGTSFGAYRLGVDYTPAFVENPAPAAPQSGLGVLSGWVCATTRVEIELIPESGVPVTLLPATGTARADTAAACGPQTTATGFGLLFNWNLLGDGVHTVRVLIADVVLAERADYRHHPRRPPGPGVSPGASRHHHHP